MGVFPLQSNRSYQLNSAFRWCYSNSNEIVCGYVSLLNNRAIPGECSATSIIFWWSNLALSHTHTYPYIHTLNHRWVHTCQFWQLNGHEDLSGWTWSSANLRITRIAGHCSIMNEYLNLAWPSVYDRWLAETNSWFQPLVSNSVHLSKECVCSKEKRWVFSSEKILCLIVQYLPCTVGWI